MRSRTHARTHFEFSAHGVDACVALRANLHCEADYPEHDPSDSKTLSKGRRCMNARTHTITKLEARTQVFERLVLVLVSPGPLSRVTQAQHEH